MKISLSTLTILKDNGDIAATKAWYKWVHLSHYKTENQEIVVTCQKDLFWKVEHYYVYLHTAK